MKKYTKEYTDAISTFKWEAGKLMAKHFNKYGLGDDIPGVLGKIVVMAEELVEKMASKKPPT